MEWQEISGNWVLLPKQPLGIIHFLGGAFVATAPQLTYRFLLEQLAQQGYIIVATPFLSSLDHKAIAVRVLNRFESIVERLQMGAKIDNGYLPIYGVGHSLGCKLHLLIGSLFNVERGGNILISFNNYPLKQAIPFFEQTISPLLGGIKNTWEIDHNLDLEFTPSPAETQTIIRENYHIRRNLLIKFEDDQIDQTLTLNPVLKSRFPAMISLLTLQGNHLTPLGQDLEWEVGEVFNPLDALGQWVKQSLSRDLYRLNREILRWLNPAHS
jgi:hypothetical protein